MWRPELSFTFLFFFLGDLTKKKHQSSASKKKHLKRNKNFQKRATLATQLLSALLRYKTLSLSL
jgi:hypothetical protein